METALVSLVCVAILLIGTVTTVFTSFKAATQVSDSLKTMEDNASDMRRTSIDATISDYSNPIVISVNNDGQTDLSDFAKWDIIAEYEQAGVTNMTYLTYAEGTVPGDNQWVVAGIYLASGANEIYDPGILNPEEKAKILVNLNPAVALDTTVRFTISTENGITSQCYVTRN